MNPIFYRKSRAILLLSWLAVTGTTAIAQPYPGGVSGASVWLKADQGVSATGVNVNVWTNQAGAVNFTGNGNPQLTTNALNFNPGITFNGSNYLTSAANVLPANNAYTKFVVFKYDGTTANNIVSSGAGGNNALFGYNTSTNLSIFHAGSILTAVNVVNNTRYFVATAGFSSGTASGTYINVDGTTKATITSSTGYLASRMQLGAHGNGNNLTGRIAEVIVYPSALGSTATATRQIQSYLGLKYGITQGHDYLASDASTIYSTTGFASNITGIGRDDNAALNQKQSRNLSTTTAQVAMALGAVATTNSANAGTFAGDKQFMIWGDNNGSVTTTAALTGWTTTTTRLTRIWKLQNTGSFNQQVTVYFPTASLNVLPGTSPYLIYNTSNTLSGGGTEVAATTSAVIGGVAHTGFTLTFSNIPTLYFSFAAKNVNPGNVPGAAVWLRGDAGVNTTGTNVSTWINQVNAGNSFTGAGNPQLTAANINFNPGITFSGSNYLTSAATVLPANSPYTKFVVFRNEGAASSNIASSGPGGDNAFIFLAPSSLGLWHTGTILSSPAGSINTTRYYLGVGGFTRNLANGAYINIDGSTSQTGTSNSAYVASAMQLGGHINTPSLVGRIAEVIVFPSSLGSTTVTTRQIESYLGLKYGITLNHNYLASDGTTITYDTTGFSDNIAGIGRDDNTALYQKQSRSANTSGQVVMALGTAAVSNTANTSAIPADKQFMIWGNDGGSIATTAALTGWTTTTTRLNRIWKLQNTGALNQQVTVYFPAANLNPLPGTNPYLIYNTSSTLAGGGTEIPFTVTTTIGGVAYKGFTVTFPTTGTLYFSFASKAVNPGNIAGASVWLRADAGVTATGTNVTGWINQVNAGNSFTGTGNPQWTSANVNFNPGITFSGSNYLTSAGTALPANSNYTKFVVFKYDAATTNNIVSSGAPGTNAFFGNLTTTNLNIFHSGVILTAPNAVSGSRYYLGTAGFSSGAASGTFINSDGILRSSVTSSAPYTASTMQLGAHNATSNLTGRIAEVIVYPSALGTGTTATNQIESYLGLKYGITLGHDYLASDGTTTTYAVATHGNNIGGIGRDDDEGLYQVQSQSLNTAVTSQVAMAVDSAAADGTINTDKQFLVWGDNNGAINTTAAVTGFTTVNNRLSRIWKLQNTGSFNQQVTVYFPTASLNLLTNSTKYLIYNTSTTLAGPGTEVAASRTATINGTAYTGFVVTFPTTGTLYFSFASKGVNPGNVSGAAMWVRADAGVNTTGTTITTWINQMNAANSLTATSNPQLSPAAVNFNPTVVFDGSDYLTSAANVPAPANNNYTKFVVFRAIQGTANNLMSAANGQPGTAMFAFNQAFTMRHGATDVAATAAGTINPGRQYLGTQIFSNGTANGTSVRLNGGANATVTSSVAYGADELQIGAYGGANFMAAGGNVAEAIVYNSALSIANTRQVESYLGLKYGLTLKSDYLSSNGSTVYTLSGYSANVAGVGRDDNTALDQRQGQSINPGNQVVMSAGSIAATNSENASAITTDQQFLVWGDNDAPGYNYNTGISQKRLSTTWKLQNTNTFNQAVTVYYPVTGLYGLGDVPMLIYGSLTSLDDGTAAQVNVGGNVTINGEEYRSFSLTFPTTAVQYFSFAGTIVPEICGNSIDDDLDEYIDELDAGCTPIPTCIATAPPLTNFGIKQDWVTSTPNALAASVSPTVADLDGDGIPEILTVRAGGTGLTYFKGNGTNLSKNTIDYNIQLPVRVGQSTMQAAVADVDRDDVPEVVTVGDDGYVYVFNNVSGSSTVYKYRSEELVSTRFGNGSPRVVDINEDGVPEIVVGLDVFQFNFGESRLVKVVTGSATAPCGMDGVGTEWGDDVVVVDIMPGNPGKEIVGGSQVYAVNLTTGTTTVLANLSTIAGAAVIPANDDGPTVVADLDNNGQLDIAYPNGSALVVWDPVAAALKMKVAYPNNAIMYRGMPAVANVYDEETIDAKPSNLPEIIFTSNLRLHAFNLNKTTGSVWSLVTTDASGETGVTAFDLNGDGVQEIIYNDETNIRVINGNTPTPANVAVFASGTATWMEHPVVVDVDNDGSAEFACVTNGFQAHTGMLRVFGPANGTSPWQGTRKIWNGRGYRPKAVNEDLTIPVKEQDITLQYPPASGKYPLDVFNCQIDARLLDPGIAPVSDLSVSDLKVANSDIGCSFVASAASLSYTLFNNGAAAAPAGTPVRFYRGDPAVAGSLLIAAVDSLAANLAVGSSVTDTVTLNLSAYTPPYTIYAVVNDNGSDPVPVALPIASTNVKECDYTNNTASVLVAPLPSDYGNLSATWPAASATVFSSDAAWLGLNVPTTECANITGDGTDGLVMTSGATGGAGTSASPWLVNGSNTVCNFTLTLNGSGTPKPVYWGVWYDANGNGSFTDSSDVFLNGNLTHGSPVTTNFSITVPAGSGATNGAIRVIATAVDSAFSKGMNATGIFTNGEVEDYFITYTTPLPVTLRDFSAKAGGKCTVTLDWTTETERNSDRYDVQRSNSGKAFQTIGSVKSLNSATGSQYSYTDNKAPDGSNYYRLIMVDADGRTQYSNTVVANVACDEVNVLLVPNPVTSVATITGLKGGDKICVRSSDGRVEMERAVTAQTAEVNMSAMSSGIHLVQVVRDGMVISNIKVTKQ